MSTARAQFLSRISSLAQSAQIDAVASRPLTEQAHNDIARMLRNGLAVVGFTALEDFIKSRISEVLSEVGTTHVPFRDLPEKLRYAVTFEAISALSYQLGLRPKSDRVTYVQEHTQKISSTASAAYELTPHAFGYDQANLQEDAVRAVLKSFLVDDPWGELTRLASRLGLAALPLEETYRGAALRRHRAAHVAHADTPQTDLMQFTKEALAIAIGFDSLLSLALSKLYQLDYAYLRGATRLNATSIVIRTIKFDSGRWRESVEGRTPAVKVERELQALLPIARGRALAAKNLLVLYTQQGALHSWECY